MISRKVLGTVVASVALGVAAVPLSSTAWAASNTSGLAKLTLEGIGPGSLAGGNCPGVTCTTGDTCECLTASYTLVGDQGFSKGDLDIALNVDTTKTRLPISDLPDSCYPAAGIGKLTNVKGTITVNMTVSGLECPTSLTGPNVFNGTYVVTGASGGKYSSSSGGTGTINGSQETTGGSVGQVAVIGTIQPTAPSSSSTSSDVSDSSSDSDQQAQ